MSLLVYKDIGETPDDIIKLMKLLYNPTKIAYSGRLDPMARGLLTILIDDETKNTPLYNKHNKTYEFIIIVGIKTDTDDILGIIEKYDDVKYDIEKITTEFENMKGEKKQDYHNYSSIYVNKKPLWYYAQNNLLHTINIPNKLINIYDIKCDENYEINNETLKNDILNRLNKLIKNNHLQFRTEKIIKQWNEFIFNEKYNIIKFTTNVSSGTYIRQIVKDVGIKLNIPLVVLEINRTSVYK